MNLNTSYTPKLKDSACRDVDVSIFLKTGLNVVFGHGSADAPMLINIKVYRIKNSRID